MVVLPVVPPRERVVEIEAALGTGLAARYRYGSGFRLGGRLVLTAAHVVAGAAAAGITVRGPDKVPHPAGVVAGLTGDPDTVDLALLEICDQAAELPAPPVATVDRDAPVPVPVEGCWAVGYPLFQEVKTAAGVVRETAQVWGMILPAENLVGGLLSLQVTSAPRALPPRREALGESQWSGMSGAAVLAGERLIGVVSEHAPRRGESTITVTPLASLGLLPAAAAAQWWAHLSADPERLVMLPVRRERAEPAYRAMLRVGEADPRRLGVHAAISVPGVPDEVLPEYVPRDADAAEFGVRAKVAAAAQRGGFVLLVGGSSVGKTRCAAEAVTALLPDWWLVHPSGSGEVAALAQAPSPRMVVWLDELQRYLDGEHALTASVVRALLDAPHPVVIIATLWPDWYAAYTTLPPPGNPDLHAREREVLELAAAIRIGPEFSAAEHDRAAAAAARDPRLRVALEATGYGLTQTLAAAPQLVARWQDAMTAHPYAWAVLTAALDATRLGARAPLSTDLLRAAAPGYCTSQQQAEAPGNWFEQALDYATSRLHGAAAALSPTGASMGQVAGYIAADYLIQYASRERRSARAPASTWDAILSHVHDPTDAARLADSASRRLLYQYALPLYRHATDAGDAYGEYAAHRLAEVLIQRGDLDEAAQILRVLADAGNADRGLSACRGADSARRPRRGGTGPARPR